MDPQADGLRLRQAARAVVLDPARPGRWDQVERFFLIEADDFEPAPHMPRERLRAEGVIDIRWWTPEELEASTALHAPRNLAHLVRRLRVDGAPPEPIDAGV